MTEWYQDEYFVKWVRTAHPATINDADWELIIEADVLSVYRYMPSAVIHRECALMYKAWEASRTLALDQAMKAVTAEPLKCISCGAIDEIIVAPCPFAQDVEEDNTPVVLCMGCRDARAEDV